MERREPNSKQRELMIKHGLNVENWLVIEDDKYQLVLINKRKSRRRTLEKRRRKYAGKSSGATHE